MTPAPVAGGSELVTARGLTKEYRDRTGATIEALAPVDFEIGASEFVTLVGPSGCGKSTLLNLIGGLIDPTGGSVTFAGEEVRAPRHEIGMMFQAPVLFPWRTVLQNTLLPADVRRERTPERVERARELLELVGLSSFESNYPKELSGGMQQRAALARLLLQDPALLLLDEPFGALDEFTREDMNMMLLDIWSSSNKAAILVTHNINEAIFLADRVFVMSPRPGRVTDVVSVELPRPRSIEMMRSSEFQEMVFAVRKVLGVL